ncbi:MAG TPA: heterodisulfide reductase-related iron-sulfur binding cluster, partial [Anaerovoracaceae bacterium]|nr:heterodisulfide reductase-related iron-sulfur binding cluster [Anaerovoracaceae bacterium]
DMDSMFLQARKELHRLDRMPWAFHDFWLRDMEFADGEFAAIIKSPPGIKMSKYAFFPGCQLGASDPRYVREAYSRLLDIDPTTALFLKCCGTPVKWSGNEEKHAETIAKLRADWESLGRPELIIACPSCINNINEFLAEAKTISLYEYMDMEGVIPVSADDISAWSVFDPCASTGNDGMRKSVRNLAEKAGLILEPLPVQEDHTACCSYGGRVSTANPEFADFVVNRRITESSNPYITYCINCRDIFLDAGKETIHILDILFGEGKKLNNCGKKLPTVTERRNNRYELKKQLLRDVWGDDIVNEKPQINIDLKIGPEMKDKLNKEHILEEEIANVIEFCESTGRTVHMAENDTFGGYRKIGYMTYWVEYKKNGKKFELINAYSHRMSIDLEAVWNGKKVEIDL